MIRALGQPLIMVPLSAVATAGMARGSESGAASAWFNMMRNVGGSIGIAGLSTLLSRRERFHSLAIRESVSVYAEATRDRLHSAVQYFSGRGSDAYSAQGQALGAIGRTVRREAFLMSFRECFLILGWVMLIAGLAVFFLKRVHVKGGGGGH